MSPGKVFVVQRPAYFDRQKRGWVNKYDLSPAEEYGDLVFLLSPGNIYKDKLESATRNLERLLKDYDPDRDHVLAIGDPVAIAATTAIAASYSGGVVNVLKYDRVDGRYDSYRITLSGELGFEPEHDGRDNS